VVSLAAVHQRGLERLNPVPAMTSSLAFGAVSHLTAGRGQMGTSLSFHLFFAVLGVGLPLMMLIAEGMHLRTGDPTWRALARRWSKVFAILFAVGAASGTIISFELGLLWPRFMAFAGGIIGLPFSLEGAAFFLEAIFVGIYLYGWDRLSPRLHWLCGFPIAVSSAASAFFIVTASAWMNVPRGFQLVHGRVTHVNVLAAMFNPAWATETSHMVLGAYLATTFGVAAVYAVGMLRGGRDAYHRKAITVSLSLAAIIAPLQMGVGDLLGRTVAQHQPATLAAIEGVTHTETGAGLNVGGIPLPGHATTVLNVKVPNLLSLLAYDKPNAPVRGLDTFPKADRTPLAGPTRLAFIGMVGIGTGLVLVSLWYWLRRRRHGTGPEDRITLLALAAAGPLAFLANELGWLVSEFGRQPWVIYGVFRTSSAITAASGLGATFTGFTLLYIALSAVTLWGVRRVSTGSPALLARPILRVS
jgi:cytochrome bd ubiquinol oxidase subunit I